MLTVTGVTTPRGERVEVWTAPCRGLTITQRDVGLLRKEERHSDRGRVSRAVEDCGADYPVANVDTEERGEETIEIVATPVATSVVPKRLDAVAAALENLPGVSHASWENEVQA